MVPYRYKKGVKELKNLTRLILLIACASFLIGTASAYDNDNGCLSPGYWKNHDWPVDSIQIGGVCYTEAQAKEIMCQPVKGDKTITLFKALVAAKLNEANGCKVPECI